jgi:succinate dehydrogenase/fumarate reductase-like Fe-S protein
MFKTILKESSASIDIFFEGVSYTVPTGISVAAAALLCGLNYVRETPVSGSHRLPYCMMGACFDCLMKIDGQPNQRACQVNVAPDMRIERQQGAVDLEDL